MQHFSSVLKCPGVEIDNQELAMSTLNELPNCFKKIKTLSALGANSLLLTLEIVYSRLLQAGQWRDMHLQNDQTESALFNCGT